MSPILRTQPSTEMAGDEDQKPVRFGILGCAYIARKVSRAIALVPGAAVAAVGSRSLDKARRFAAENALPPSTRTYGSYEAVLDDPDVDAVYVPLPTSLHLQWAVAAAERNKHVLLEKPTALSAADLDVILSACVARGLQFMDATMWMHHPRTAKMKELISDPVRFGPVRSVHSNFSYCAGGDFLTADIRVKPDLDALGGLGDMGWYCIRAILWSVGYQLPATVVALPGTVKNEEGVILACGGSMLWEDGKVATFHCSFLSTTTMELSVVGAEGAVHVGDFVIPVEEGTAEFRASGARFAELQIGWEPKPEVCVVGTELPQDALMVREFAMLVRGVRDGGEKPEGKWMEITKKTQVVVDALKKSIDGGEVAVHVGLVM